MWQGPQHEAVTHTSRVQLESAAEAGAQVLPQRHGCAEELLEWLVTEATQKKACIEGQGVLIEALAVLAP